MALFLRNTRPYLPLLRSSRPAIALASRAFASRSDEVSSRSSVGLGFRNGGASGEGISDHGVTAFTIGATPTTAPHGDTDGATSGLREELVEDGEDGFDFANADYGLTNGSAEMTRDIMVTFLGTGSGGGPTKTRNCSSLVVDVLGNGSLWSACYPYNFPMFRHFPYQSFLFRLHNLGEGS